MCCNCLDDSESSSNHVAFILIKSKLNEFDCQLPFSVAPPFIVHSMNNILNFHGLLSLIIIIVRNNSVSKTNENNESD